MEMGKPIDFDNKQPYRLVAVKDKAGNDKINSKQKELVVCFEGYDKKWLISPRESESLIPTNCYRTDV